MEEFGMIILVTSSERLEVWYKRLSIASLASVS